MPMLNAGIGPYRVDTKFEPITMLTLGNRPDYGLFFSVGDTYLGDDFAFDDCADFDQRLCDKIDDNFLICRYERLYKSKAGRYYLVPWMAIPYTEVGTGPPALLGLYDLKVDPPKIDYGWPPSGVLRKLQLVSSHTGITANWVGAPGKGDIIEKVDLKIAFPIAVTVTILDNAMIPEFPANVGHGFGEYIEIHDITAPVATKIVGKLRIIFVEQIVQQACLIEILDQTGNPNFIFRLRDTAHMPKSLESDGKDANPPYVHEELFRDANSFGYGQIGLHISIKNSNVDIYQKNGGKILGATNGDPITYSVPKSSISKLADYDALLVGFLDLIAQVEVNGRNVSKYSLLYIFLTPFDLQHDADHRNLRGESIFGEYVYTITITNGSDDPTTKQIDLARPSVLNASLFRTILNTPGAGNFQFFDHHHQYSTLVHELGHALLANEYFESPLPDRFENYNPQYADLYSATKWLLLYLKDRYVEETALNYDSDKIRIEDFRTEKITSSRETLFDRVIDIGMSGAVDEFIDHTIFPIPLVRPPFWGSPATTKMPMADLVIWRSLNDLVKFVVYHTSNIMDYVKASPPLDANPANNAAFLPRRIVRFNRFQWELFRRTVKHLNDLVPE